MTYLADKESNATLTPCNRRPVPIGLRSIPRTNVRTNGITLNNTIEDISQRQALPKPHGGDKRSVKAKGRKTYRVCPMVYNAKK